MTPPVTKKATRFLGNDSAFMNILVVAEGFTASTMPEFNTACGRVKAAIKSQQWYNMGKVKQNLAFWKYPLTSGKSGVTLGFAKPAEPSKCANYQDWKTAKAASVSFNTMLGTDGCESVAGDSSIKCFSEDVARYAGIPNFSWVIVFVRSSFNAGLTTAEACWVTVSTELEDWTLHELGHALGLDDEYEPDDGQADVPPGQGASFKGQKNNVVGFDHAVASGQVPWQGFINAAFTLPAKKQDCLKSSVVNCADAIGVYEGAGNYHCLCYRSAPCCKMRKRADAFCELCCHFIAFTFDSETFDDPTYVA